MVSYTKPAPEVIFHCNCCDEDMTVDQDEYVYNGNEKFADHDLCPMESVDGDICQECLDNHYSQCDGCKKWIHDENSTYIQHLNKTVCEKCMENYSSCTTCGMIEHFENVTYHDGEDYCSGCAADQLYFCDHCCETVFMEDVVWDDKDRGFCSDKCRDNANPGGIEWTRLKRKLQL